jgi:PhoD-like phosphatase
MSLLPQRLVKPFTKLVYRCEGPMPDNYPIPSPNYRLRLPKDGPLIGWTRWSTGGQSVLANIFATPDDSESDPAAGLLVSYLAADGARRIEGIPRSQHKGDPESRAPYFNGTLVIPTTDFKDGKIELEVLALHAIATTGKVYFALDKVPLVESLTANAGTFNYDDLRRELEERLQSANALLQDPQPSSHSFEDRSDRSLDEALVTLRLPPKKTATDTFKLIATTCRYPGFAFETGRVDGASYNIINQDHANASGLLLLGDQIYADATASLFDNLTTIEKFQERYHALFRSPGFARAVRTIPAYMTGDDHEFSNGWSKPDDRLSCEVFKSAQQSYTIYQISHSPFKGALDTPPYDYSFDIGPAAVYVMDTLSNRDTTTPGAECIVSADQLNCFKIWLSHPDRPEFIILATGGVVAPDFTVGLGNTDATDVHRAQGLDNWQAFNGQRIELLKILAEAKNKKILLIAGDYHCAAEATITAGDGTPVAKAAVVPPAYAPMRYVNQTTASLARHETTDGFRISLDTKKLTDGSGYAVITIKDNNWLVKFETLPVADAGPAANLGS